MCLYCPSSTQYEEHPSPFGPPVPHHVGNEMCRSKRIKCTQIAVRLEPIVNATLDINAYCRYHHRCKTNDEKSPRSSHVLKLAID
jgi:hypothetical protein